MAWSTVALPTWPRWTGAFLAVFAVPPLLFWTFHSLGKNLTDTVVTRRQHTLVTHGPYRWVRHPFYDVVLLWIISLSLFTGSWIFALLGVSAFTMMVVRTRIEEEKLVGALWRRVSPLHGANGKVPSACNSLTLYSETYRMLCGLDSWAMRPWVFETETGTQLDLSGTRERVTSTVRFLRDARSAQQPRRSGHGSHVEDGVAGEGRLQRALSRRLPPPRRG